MFTVETDREETRRRIRAALDGYDDVEWYVDEGDRIVAYETEMGVPNIFHVVELADVCDSTDRTVLGLRTEPDAKDDGRFETPQREAAVALATHVVDRLRQRDDVELLHEFGGIDVRDLDADPIEESVDTARGAETVGRSDSNTSSSAEPSASKALESAEAVRKRNGQRAKKVVLYVVFGIGFLGAIGLASYVLATVL